MKNVLLFILGIIIVIFVAQVLIFGWKFIIGKNLARHSQSFSYKLDSPIQRILVVGDSTAVGTGVKDPINSTAGYFHQDFPNAEIVNLAKNGAKVNKIIKTFDQAQGKFDLVLIQGGANNIIYFTPLETAAAEMDALIKKAKKYSDNVVLLTSGNVGTAPIFPAPLSWIYTTRARKFLAEFEKTATSNGVLFVRLFQEKVDDIFLSDVKKYYAADGLHLTAEGYKVWYEQIRKTMAEGGIELNLAE